jgi:carbohydrate-selective porin OprB
VEAFYQYRLNDNISITPGVVWLTAPDHNQRNQDVVIGTVRTTFTF